MISRTFILCGILLLAGIADARQHGGYPFSYNTALVGLNVSGLEDGSAVPGTAGVDYPVPTSAELAYYHSKGLNTIRLPFLWDRMQLTLGGTLNSTYLGYVQTFVSQASALGMKVILDCHNYGGYGGIKIGAMGGPTSAQFGNLWLRLATAFAGNPGIGGYDLMNEPSGMPSSAVWPAAAQAAITTIRTVDTATAIYVEGDGFASAFQWLVNGNDGLRTLVDPNSNLVFEAHAYGDYNNSGTYPIYPNSAAVGCTSGQTSYQCAQGMGDQLTSPASTLDTGILVKRAAVFGTWCKTYNLSCLLGESGVPADDPHWLTALDNEISYLLANNITLAYWSAGPFDVGFPLGVEPSNGVDTVQVAVLTKYTNAQQPTVYQLSGPARGMASAASGNFTMAYEGYVKSPFTVTPNDGGAGGTFTPSSVTIQPGFNGLGTFTYTAPGTDVYALATTNNAQLTDPSAVGYATVGDMFVNATCPPTNVWGLHKIYAPYIGPGITLRRASDNAIKSFGFTSLHLNAPLDTAAIATWAGASNLYVVTQNSQEPNHYDAGPPDSVDNADGPGGGSALPAGTYDQPRFILSDQNGLPAIRWNASRMDAVSPIAGNPGQTIVTVQNTAGTSTTAGNTYVTQSFETAWTEVQNYQFANAGTWSLNAEPLVEMYYDSTGAFHTYVGRYNTNQHRGIQTYKDGALVGAADSSQTSINFQFRNVVNRGYFKFYPSYFAGDVAEQIIFPCALSDSDLTTIQTALQSYWATPATPAPPTIPTPPTPNPTAATTLPSIGVNLAGMEFGGQPFYPTANEAAYYQSRSMGIVRLPFTWERMQPTLSSALDPTFLANVQTVVTNMQNQGLNVLLDLHNYCQYNGHNFGTTGSFTQSDYVDFWTRMAAAFPPSSYPKVNFDLMNEPAECTAAQMGTLAQAAITAIRGQSFTNYIFVEGGGSFSSALGFVTSGWAAVASTLTDPSSKLVFEPHSYLDNDQSGSHNTCTSGAGATSLVAATTYARANSLKLFLGEFGVANTADCLTENGNMLAYMHTNDDVWVGWTAWGGGPAWPESYLFKLDPDSFFTPYVDRPNEVLLVNNRGL